MKLTENSVAALTYRRDMSKKRLKELKELKAPQFIIDKEVELLEGLETQLADTRASGRVML